MEYNIKPKVALKEKGYGITSKQVSSGTTCPSCAGLGEIIHDRSHFYCSNCNGMGIVGAPVQRWFVEDEPIVIEKIKATLTLGGITYKYQGSAGQRRMNRSQDTLFVTKEEAQKACDERNREYKNYPIADIKIPGCFALSIPSSDKITARIEEYKAHKRFSTRIRVDKSGMLTDGYSAYLVAKMLGLISLRAEIS